MNYILFDDPDIRPHLLPFTFTRPVAHIRVGILTIAEKWQKVFDQPLSSLTQPYLQPKFPLVEEDDTILINGALCPSAELITLIKQLQVGEALQQGDCLLACRIKGGLTNFRSHLTHFSAVTSPVTLLKELCDIFANNGDQIRADFALLTKDRISQPLSDPHTIVYNPDSIFIEEGAVIRAAVLSAVNGPIYIGRNAQVLEGAIIRGPFAMGEQSIVNVGARMLGDNTLGPQCKVGGEVSNSVFFGYTSKVHDGYLGNSVVGEWCNLGADTNTSNMKNDYANVKIWNYPAGQLKDTGRLFCGLMMGDHSKAGINTMFNTGTVVGVNANIFGAGFPPKYIPSFSWGGADGFDVYKFDKALEVARRAMQRRGQELLETDEEILKVVSEMRETSLSE